MQVFDRWILMVVVCLFSTTLYGQCNSAEVPAPGLTCSEAPILCQIDCLDGFRGTLPGSLVGDQPENLCNGGNPNNLSWFAFVAGSDSINLTIIPSNCMQVDSSGSNLTGIQAGIYSNCDFDDDDRFVMCQTECSDQLKDLTFGSSDFEVGQIYYFFVDGCAGAVCDYEVRVNFGKQAFEMPEFTTISNEFGVDFSTETICAGAEIDVTLDNFNLNVDYNWSISPAPANYPGGEHPVKDSSTVTWNFDEPGNYKICVFANNSCDVNNEICFDVTVDSLANEVFSDIDVCQECFPIVLSSSDTTCVIGDIGLLNPSILTEDPNGDGVVGWLGTDPIMTPGRTVYTVDAQYGCTYDQIVNINRIPLSSRENVTVYRCSSDFPFDFHGTTITGAVSNRFITIDNAAASRCDSLISLTVEVFGEKAAIYPGECRDSGVELLFDLGATLPDGATITYNWTKDGATVTDSDGIDTTLFTMDGGVYAIEVVITIDGQSCSFTTLSDNIDLNNLTPAIPTFGAIDNQICKEVTEVQLYVESVPGVTYEWSTIPNLPFRQGATTDTIYVDITNNLGFQYCVNAVNNCGKSRQGCQIFKIDEPSDIDFDISPKSCVDSIVTVSFTGSYIAPGSTVVWDFGDADIVTDGGDSGPYEVRFTSAGSRTISLSVTNGTCDQVVTKSIAVLSSQNPPTLTCVSDTDRITYTVSGLPVGATYTVNVLDGIANNISQADSTITISGLEPNTAISINVSIESDCGTITSAASQCITLDCPTRTVAIESPSGNSFCLDGSVSDITLQALVDGVLVTSGGQWSGNSIDQNGNITVANLGPGVFDYEYVTDSMGGCVYRSTFQLTLQESPSLNYEVIYENCQADAATVILSSSIAGTLTLDGITTASGTVTNVGSGSHTARIVANGCEDEITFVTGDITTPQVAILGNAQVIEGREETYTIESNISNPASIVWTVNGTEVCTGSNCTTYSYTPQEGDRICVTLNTVEGCIAENCIDISVTERTNVYLPNIFSPNGDGNNDHFYPISNVSPFPVESMSIIDRWGNSVYTQKNITMGEEASYWDGTFNGKQMSSGVYVYTLIYYDENNVQRLRKGTVTLLR